MDAWIKKESGDGALVDSVRAPSCPLCGQLVLLCNRYSNEIKAFFQQLVHVKASYMADDSRRIQIEKVREELVQLLPLIRSNGLEEQAAKSILKESCDKKELKRDDCWDQLNRCVLVYHFYCLLLDLKRSYSYSASKKSPDLKYLKLDLNSTNTGSPGSLLQEVWIALGFVTERPIFAHAPAMLEQWRRLDYLRQLCVVNATMQALPESRQFKQKTLKSLIETANLAKTSFNPRLTKEDRLRATEVFKYWSIDFHTDLKSSVKSETSILSSALTRSHTNIGSTSSCSNILDAFSYMSITPAEDEPPVLLELESTLTCDDDHYRDALFKILRVSLRTADVDKGGLILSDVDPHHPILFSADLGSSTAADLIIESLDLIISGSQLADSLFEDGSSITPVHYLVDCMLHS